jgi:hypothetical protein
MKPVDQLQTMTLTYQEICQGEEPWVALGNFMNDWFDYAKDRRAELVADPIVLPALPGNEMLRWAAFCAASVEYLCELYGVPCPSWVHNPAYRLSEAWFDALSPQKPQVRERLIQQTPEPFVKRNIYCGNRMFANKYEFVEQYRHLLANLPYKASEVMPGA